ncbi:unnamed protein product [Cylicocyclus nassatus]|uniref:Potassium channel tetramerisation-type BTB domain-containing protein n=1 Tax=Cylicocyclus nassatus TaxID=53992 RepID=A0AA36GUR7_CYLNA|nr:unnamed protein product [Cylicocyclus nassatus]
MSYQVLLNVRGERYLTTTKTLRNCPDTNDKSLFLKLSIPRTGELYLDRDPELFQCIFLYLLDGKLVLRYYDDLLIEMLQEEAEYFGLPSLAHKLSKLKPFQGVSRLYKNVVAPVLSFGI